MSASIVETRRLLEIEVTREVVAGCLVLGHAGLGPDHALCQIDRREHRSPEFDLAERMAVHGLRRDRRKIGAAAHQAHGDFQHIGIRVARTETERVRYQSGQ